MNHSTSATQTVCRNPQLGGNSLLQAAAVRLPATASALQARLGKKVLHATAGKKFNRLLFAYARVLHIYLSMALFALLLLFCATGIVLNHVAWLDGGSTSGDVEMALPEMLRARLAGDREDLFSNFPLDEIRQLLKTEFGLHTPSRIDIDEEVGEVIFDYKLPAGYAAAIVNVNEASLLLEYNKGSVLNVMGDLHKGRHSGAVWSWLIDLSAGLMIVFSITGMIILLQNRKHRVMALACAVLGLLTPFLIYRLCVPGLSGV